MASTTYFCLQSCGSLLPRVPDDPPGKRQSWWRQLKSCQALAPCSRSGRPPRGKFWCWTTPPWGMSFKYRINWSRNESEQKPWNMESPEHSSESVDSGRKSNVNTFGWDKHQLKSPLTIFMVLSLPWNWRTLLLFEAVQIVGSSSSSSSWQTCYRYVTMLKKKTPSPGPEAGAAPLAGTGWRSRDEGTSPDFLIRESETKEKWDFDCEPFEVPTFGLVWKQNGCIRSALTSFCWFLSFSFKRLPYFRKPSINKNHPRIKNWILIQRCLCFLSPCFTLPSFPAFSVGSKNTSIGTHTFQNDSLKRNEDASVT